MVNKCVVVSCGYNYEEEKTRCDWRFITSLRSNDEVDKHKQCTWNFQFQKNDEVLDQKWVKFVCRKESKHLSVWPLRVKIFNLWKTESTIKF